ncbi:MAG: hypothetical protein IKT47_08635 [Oscillospiraceae bacterium]|nr:hypothetical protein [Oscillospiraceae bacterium]
MKKYLPRVIFAILCAAIAILPLLRETEEEYTYAKALHYFYGAADDNTCEMTFFTPDGEVCRLTAPDGRYYIDMALDRSYAFAIIGLNADSGGELYYVSPEGAKHIANGVYACLSSDRGGSAAYITDFSKTSDTCRLMYYNGKTTESLCIDENLWALNSVRYNGAAISPDGCTVVYNRFSSANEHEGMMWKNGKHSSLGDVFPIAVADKGRYIYYLRTDTGDYTSYSSFNRYYVLSPSGEQLISPYTVDGYFYFNRDFSEALFSCYDETNSYSYFCVDGSTVLAANELTNISAIATPNGELAGEYQWWSIIDIPRLENYSRYGIDSFRSKLLLSQSSVGWCGNNYVYPAYYVDENLQISAPLDYNSSTFSTDGLSAIYSYGPELYYVENYPTGEPLYIGQSNGAVQGSFNGQIYYLPAGQHALYLWETGNRTRVADNISLLHHRHALGADRNRADSFDLSRTYLPPVNGYLYFTEQGSNDIYCLTPDGSIQTVLTLESLASAPYVCCYGGAPLLMVNTGNRRWNVYRFDGATATLVASNIAG